MKVILVMVMSADGKTTRGSETGIYEWTSPEDQDYFFSEIAKNNLIIMGKSTYLASQSKIKLEPQKLRIILTSQFENFQQFEVPGQLEFHSQPITELLTALEERGYQQALLVGGAWTNSTFFQEERVSEVWLTIEPLIFGSGRPLLLSSDESEKLEIKLTLISMEQLNSMGTLLLKYRVL